MKLRGLVLLTLVCGVAIGLGYAWLVDPVTYTESSPAQVVTAYRQAWLIMAAEAFAQDGDWDRTRVRIDALHDPNLNQTVKELFERYAAQGAKATARALARLADRLNARTAPMLVYLTTPIVTPTPAPTSTSRPIVSAAPRPTATTTVTLMPFSPIVTPASGPLPLYQLIDRTAECTPATASPQIRVIVQDADGNSLSGKDIWITWEGGADRFVTGLKPEIDPGYGDFDMALDQSYNVSIDKPTTLVVSGLQTGPCAGEGHLTWRLVFRTIAR